MAKSMCRNFCTFRFFSAQCPGKMVQVFPGALSTEKPKREEISTQVLAMQRVSGVAECYVAVYGGIRKCLTAPDRIYTPKIICTHMAQMGLGRPKICIFSTEISAWCAFGCKYFSMGWMSQKGPEGSKVCAKTSLNPIRHSNPEILHFESEKNLHFVNKWEESFKGKLRQVE